MSGKPGYRKIYKIMQLSPKMSEFMGINRATRQEVQAAIWHHIKRNSLLSEKHGHFIHLDDTLKNLFPEATDPFSMFELTRYIKAHTIGYYSASSTNDPPNNEKENK